MSFIMLMWPTNPTGHTEQSTKKGFRHCDECVVYGGGAVEIVTVLQSQGGFLD